MSNQNPHPGGYREIIESETGIAYGTRLYPARYARPSVFQGGHLVIHRQRAIRAYVPPYHAGPPIDTQVEYQLPAAGQAYHQSPGYAASSRNQLVDPRTLAQDLRSAYDGAQMVQYQNSNPAPSSNRTLRPREDMRQEVLSQGNRYRDHHLLSIAGTSLNAMNNRRPPTSNIEDLRRRRRAKNDPIRIQREAGSAIRDDLALRNHINNGRSQTTEDNVRSWLEHKTKGGASSAGGPMGASVAATSTQHGERMSAGRNFRLHGDSNQASLSSSGYCMSEDSARALRDWRRDDRWS
jgi:hypothetical protein